LLQLKYTDSAEKVLSRAFETSPGNPLLTVGGGHVEQQQGRSDAALSDDKKALTEQPKLIAALVGFAQVNIAQGKDEEAQKYLHQALSIEPDNPSANGELGSVEAKQENWGLALTHLGRAWAVDRSNQTIGLQLARALQHSGRNAAALQVLTSLQPAMRDSSAFHLELAQLYTKLQRSAEAREERNVVAKLDARAEDSIRFENPTTYVH
jgi:predicted Zn-dependent protease